MATRSSSRVGSDVDLHLAVELLERGCPPETSPRRILPLTHTSERHAAECPRRCCRPRLDPVARQRRHRHRPAAHPHVRADAAARDRGVHRADRRALDAARRRLGSRPAGRRLGRRVRDRRRARSTTTSRAGTRSRPSGGARSRSGRAASASGAGSCSAASPARSSSAARARACGSSRTRSRPGLLLAQGIGRWGNWFNQELFGKPTDLPWGLKIDERHRPPQYIALATTFHPTFLYEFVYDLSMAGVLLLIGLALPDQAAGRCSRSTSPSTPSGAPSRSCCGSTRRTTSSASG